MKKKILIIFGTRPEAIKLMPITLKLKNDTFFDTKICVTGQHRDMLDGVLNCFDIVPDFDLSIMKPSQTLAYITESVLSGIDAVLEEFCPDIMLVHGDTSTAFSAALAGFYRKIPVGHVEAGLRSHNMFSPYPEEFNRRAIALMASLHFAPTKLSAQNLKKEGVDECKIHVVGNTVIDTLVMNTSNLTAHSMPDSPFALMTVHRRENSQKNLTDIFNAVKRICLQEPSIKIIYPVHKSPRVFNLAQDILKNVDNITLCEPLGVKDFHKLLAKCHFVLTDSGGIQEEAAFLGKPVLVLRENTERPEATLCGTSRIIGSNEDKIFDAVISLIHDPEEYQRMSRRCFEFGDGHASERIIEILRKY